MPPVELAGSETVGKWFPDRYAPAVFQDASGYLGRDGVIRAGVSWLDSSVYRPSNYSSTFYNTQGRKYDISGGDGSYVEFALYIPQSWSDPANGFVSTGLWTTMVDGAADVSAYPIIGFSNFEGSGPRFRVWDLTTGYVNLSTVIEYDEWAALRITLSGSTVEYSINGQSVFSVNEPSTVAFKDVMLQVYNFGTAFDTNAMGIANNPAGYSYDTYWSSVTPEVPEPGTWALVAAGIGIASWMKRRAV